MAVTGLAGTMESWKVATGIKQDESESDVDHKEMIHTYACDAYLSKWLPNIKNDPTISEDDTVASKHEKVKQNDRKGQQRPISLKVSPKSPSQSQQESDDSKDTKVNHESKRKTYFEAIKCSPMKLRQSIVSQQRCHYETTKKRYSRNGVVSSRLNEQNNESVSLSENTIMKQCLPNPPVEGKASKTKSTMTPCVVEMTGGPLGELGSLCFKTKDPARRRSDLVYTSLAGGKMRKLHKSKKITSGRNKGEFLVRCESVMIYPKVLVNPRTEKSSPKSLFYPREAWKDTDNERYLSPKKAEDVTRLPDLKNEESVTMPSASNQRSSPKNLVLLARSPGKFAHQRSQNSTSTKIIVPFGEDEPKQTGETRTEKQLGQNSEIKGTERSTNDPCNEQVCNTKSRHEHLKTRNSRFFEKPRRKISGMVIGITQLEIPRRSALVTKQVTATSGCSSINKLQFLTTEVNDLYLGNENLPPQKSTSPRYLFSPRKRVDYSRKNTHNTPTGILDNEQENSKYFLSQSKTNLSLKIGGTGLLRENRDLQDNFDEMKDIEDKKRVHFNVLVPHSRYFT